ncbi:MAG: pilus assembly protein [Gammaproteobacteria bacterium]|nr:pilus assembly protein [Gammaproteobacteria bacterium]
MVSNRRYGRQQGAALVEFTLTFMVFLILILAIIEFSLVVYDASRLAEATRAATRLAIVSTPSCNILGKKDENGILLPNASTRCPDPSQLACTGDTVELVVSNCEDPATTPECKMVALMDQMMLRGNNSILADSVGQVRITYACSSVGDPAASVVPMVTVAAENIQHPMMFASIFGFYSPGGSGIGRTITLPRFETTRTGEDMYSN